MYHDFNTVILFVTSLIELLKSHQVWHNQKQRLTYTVDRQTYQRMCLQRVQDMTCVRDLKIII